MSDHLPNKGRIAAIAMAGTLVLSVVSTSMPQAALAAPMPMSRVAGIDAGAGTANESLQDIRYRRRSGSAAGAVIGLGVLGLGAAAIASQQRRGRYRDYEGERGFYDNRGYGEQRRSYGRRYDGYNRAPGFYDDRYRGY